MMPASALVLRSTDTSIVGGLAVTWAAESPRKPVGPSSPSAVTTVIPVARCPSAVQKALASISPPDVTVKVVMSEPAVVVCNRRPIADDTADRKLRACAGKQQKSNEHDQGSSLGVGRARVWHGLRGLADLHASRHSQRCA